MTNHSTRIFAAASLLTLAVAMPSGADATRSMVITASPDIRVVVPLSADPMQQATLTEKGDFILYANEPMLDEDGNPINDPYGYPVTEQKIYFQTPAPNMKEIVVSDEEGVGTVTDGLRLLPDFGKGVLSLRGVSSRVEIAVYTIDGKSVERRPTDTDTDIDLARHGKGLYIVNVSGTDFKFLVK